MLRDELKSVTISSLELSFYLWIQALYHLINYFVILTTTVI